jgi:ABC-type glycerol-3-phosphate transport system substrate-binding protein
MPRQDNLPPCDTYNTLTSSSQDNNPSDIAQFYATPPAFAKNFIVDSNLSFDDSEDIPNVSLDTVPDVINDPSATNDIYYSYPEHKPVTVNKHILFFTSFFLFVKNKTNV